MVYPQVDAVLHGWRLFSHESSDDIEVTQLLKSEMMYFKKKSRRLYFRVCLHDVLFGVDGGKAR